MTQNALITAVRTAAERDGINFYTGSIYRINSELKNVPAIWLHPPKVIEKQGCCEGLITYEIAIDVIEQCCLGIEEERGWGWQEIENRAHALCRTIAMDPSVKSVGSIQIIPAENSLSNRGEISAHLKARVDMPFLIKIEKICI